MRTSRIKLRYSLRALCGVTLLIALGVQAITVAWQHRHERRREAIVADVREQIIVSQRLQTQYATRLLAYIERRITSSPDAAFLSAYQRRQFGQFIQGERTRRAKFADDSQRADQFLAYETCPW